MAKKESGHGEAVLVLQKVDRPQEAQAVTILSTYYVPGSLLLPCRPSPSLFCTRHWSGITLPFTDEGTEAQ